MLFNKDFIMNNKNKIRNCGRNIAKMNILEYIIFDVFITKNYSKDMFKMPFEDLIDSFEDLIGLLQTVILSIIAIILGILFPISMPLRAYINIKNARKE